MTPPSEPTLIRHLLFLLALLLLPGVIRPQALLYGGDFGDPLIRETVREIEIAHDHRDYDHAWELAGKALAKYPNSYEVVRSYISVAESVFKIKDALEHFEPRGLEGEPAAVAHYARGWAAILIGDPVFAQQELKVAKRLAVKRVFEIERASLVADRVAPGSDEQDLMERYRAFVGEYPDNGLAWLSYLNTFNFYGAGGSEHREALAKALAAKNKAPQLYIRAAELKEREFWFDPEDGLELVETGLTHFPESTELALRSVMYLRQLGRTEEALALTRKYRAIAPNHADFRVDEREILTDLGRLDEAIEACRKLREVTYQDRYLEDQPYRLARLLHMANRPQEAIDILNDFIRNSPTASTANAAYTLLTRLQARAAGEKVVRVKGLGYTQQRGNYCGPATVSMIVRKWDKDESQEEIADRVYTGIAGTPPQVIYNYAKTLGLSSVEFSATEEVWKRLIDAGFPILWLQMSGRRGGHYRVIEGYDDVLKNWIVHDPNFMTRTEIPFKEIDDNWFLPSLRRSIVLFPPERAGDPALAGLKPTMLLLVTNWVLYVATGSNLFVGLFPAVLVNLACALVVALAVRALLARISYPSLPFRRRTVMLAVVGLIMPLNLIIAVLRWGEAVSVLLGIHLALLSLIPLLLLIAVLQKLVQDYFHPIESAGVAFLITAVWVVLSFVDQAPWETVIPIGIFVIGLPILLWGRLRIRAAETALRTGDPVRALEIVRPWGSMGRRYFAGICVELDAWLRMGELRTVKETSEAFLRERSWSRANEEALQVHRLMALALLTPADAQVEVDSFLARKTLSPTTRTVAEGLRLFLAPRASNPVGEDDLLRRLHRAAQRSLPGMPPTQTASSRTVLQSTLLLAVEGAREAALARNDNARAEALFESWGRRHGLLFRLLSMGMGEGITARPEADGLGHLGLNARP